MGFNIDGVTYYVHEFKHANILTTTYMTTANLPIRYEIVASAGASGTHDLTHICSAVFSEGGFEEERGFPFQAERLGVSVASGGTYLMSIRPKATFNGIVNRATILPKFTDVYSEDQILSYNIVYGGTLTGSPSFNSVDAESVTEFDIAATGVTGGIVIGGGFVAAAGAFFASTPGASARGILSRLPLTLNIAGAHPTSPYTDNLSIVAASQAVGATDAGIKLLWQELR